MSSFSLNDLPNIDKLKKKLGCNWYVYPIGLDTKNNLADINEDKKDELFCVHCQSKDLVLLASDNYQTVIGNSSEWVYKCNNCGKDMTVIRES